MILSMYKAKPIYYVMIPILSVFHYIHYLFLGISILEKH